MNTSVKSRFVAVVIDASEEYQVEGKPKVLEVYIVDRTAKTQIYGSDADHYDLHSVGHKCSVSLSGDEEFDIYEQQMEKAQFMACRCVDSMPTADPANLKPGILEVPDEHASSEEFAWSWIYNNACDF